MKSLITISRHWENPKINTTLDAEGISLKIELDDFISALKHEIGPVAWIFTNQAFSSKVDAAVKSVIKKIKEESAKAI